MQCFSIIRNAAKMMVYKKRLIDHHTWLPQLDSNQRPGRSVAYARYFAKNSPPDCFLYAVTPAYLSDLGVE